MNLYYISTSFAIKSRIAFEMCLVENTAKKWSFGFMIWFWILFELGLFQGFESTTRMQAEVKDHMVHGQNTETKIWIRKKFTNVELERLDQKNFEMEIKKNLVGKEIKETITQSASKEELIELGAKWLILECSSRIRRKIRVVESWRRLSLLCRTWSILVCKYSFFRLQYTFRSIIFFKSGFLVQNIGRRVIFNFLKKLLKKY